MFTKLDSQSLCIYLELLSMKVSENLLLYRIKVGNGPNGHEMPHRMKKEFCDQMIGPLYVKVVFTYIYFHRVFEMCLEN